MRTSDHTNDEPDSSGNQSPTPIMAQFLVLKQANPGSLLFFRMGDFYELFFEDAEIAARALGITLTRRGKHLGQDIPMCGVPIHAADGYLEKLIRLGHRVAVCEQLEDPSEARKRGSRAVVRRDVVRLVTPGTLTEDSLLDSRSNNFLVAVVYIKADGDVAIAWADISSGELAVTSATRDRVASDLMRLDPREIIVPERLLEDQELHASLSRPGAPITPVPSVRFDSISADQRLREHFEVKALEGFGSFTRAEISALGGLLDYITITQAGQVPHLRPPRRDTASEILLLDPATRANLEITRTLQGERRGSLLSIIDLSVTAGGSRCISMRIANPLCDPYAIAHRLDEVSHFYNDAALRREVRELLLEMPDLERALSRIAIGRGTPRDLAAIRDGLRTAKKLAGRLSISDDVITDPKNINQVRDILNWSDQELADELQAALADELPALARDGNFIRTGYSQELDENRTLRDKTRQFIATLQSRYCELTGIRNLKVKYNNLIGYFVEVPAIVAEELRRRDLQDPFIHRQTVANAMRFVTSELTSLDQRITMAAEKALALEHDIFTRLCGMIVSRKHLISELATASANIDAASALAELAERRRYVRPRIDGSTCFTIKGGRHPVVEASLLDTASGSFVANDCELPGDGKRLCLLTGPNMAGKSTFLRQNALIILLAQMGSFVPADEAHFGVVDRLFSRVGAADDLARGRSTFMVEMIETAAILNQANEKSFVILDEIGRGTATYDGLSIAWATLEHLHGVNKCRALFATHYHELTALAAKLPHIANATMKVREWQDQIIFLHEVTAGVADRSYGIHVAKLAGLPSSVVSRAQLLLEHLEDNARTSSRSNLIDQLPLFAAASQAKNQASKVEQRLRELVADDLSPREALSLVYELISLARDAGK